MEQGAKAGLRIEVSDGQTVEWVGVRKQRTTRLHKLTKAAVERAMRKGATVYDGGGLELRDGSSWVWRYISPKSGKRRQKGLGSVEAIDLDVARDLCKTDREMVAKGIDPLDAQERQRRAQLAAKTQERAHALETQATLRREARRVHEAVSGAFKNAKHRSQWINSIEQHVPERLLDKPVAQISPVELLDALLPVYRANRETGNRVRQRLETVFDDCALRNYCAGNPVTVIRKKLSKDAGKQKKDNHRALPYAKAPAFYKALRKEAGTAARALEFLLLTASRTNEVLGTEDARTEEVLPFIWAELDLEARTWIVPKARMKREEEHTVYLTPRAIEILEGQLGQHKSIVFPSPQIDGKPLSNMSMLETLKRMNYYKLTTVHGLRSTFSTWANECYQSPADAGGDPRDVVEAALAHKEGNRVRAAYNRAKFIAARKALLIAWEEFLTGNPRR